MLRRCLLFSVRPRGVRLLTSASVAGSASGEGATSKAPQLPPAALLLALHERPKISVAKFEHSGRGLVAAQPIDYGETLFRERPMLCYPTWSLMENVCFSCLSVLHPTTPRVPARNIPESTATPRWLCRPECASATDQRFYALESLAPQGMVALEQYCKDNGERFPLMVARLAFMHLSDALAGEGDSSHAPKASPEEGVYQGNALSDVNFLCFANVGPEPYPEPWVRAYGLLRGAMEEASATVLASAIKGDSAAMQERLGSLDLTWFVSVLSRLHINVFKVGAVLPMDSLRCMSGDGTSGSAAYLVSSLFNHSCEPNVDVVFPRNDGMASFVAARDIEQGEQLFISYIDSYSMGFQARQKHLRYSYGFHCRCQLCQEEAAEIQSPET